MPYAPSTRILRFAGWSAYLSAGLSIISGIFFVLFYALDVPRMSAANPNAPQTFGTLNDIATVFQALCMLPLTVALHRLAPPDRRGISLISVAIGIVGLLGVVIAQALLVTRVFTFAVNLPVVMAAFGLFGIWMFQANCFARESGSLPPRLARLGEATGVAFILMSAIILLFELINWRDPSALVRLAAFAQQDILLIRMAIMLAILVFLVLFIAFFLAVPLWLIGLGRRLFAIARASEPVPGESLVYSGT